MSVYYVKYYRVSSAAETSEPQEPRNPRLRTATSAREARNPASIEIAACLTCEVFGWCPTASGAFSFVSAVLALTCSCLPALRAQSSRWLRRRTPAAEPRRDFSHDVPAHLAFVDGEVTLERDGKLEPAEREHGAARGRSAAHARRPRRNSVRRRQHARRRSKTPRSICSSTRSCGWSTADCALTIPRSTEDLDYRIDAPRGVRRRSDRPANTACETGVDRHGEADVDLIVFRGTRSSSTTYGRTLVRAGRSTRSTSADARAVAALRRELRRLG